MPVIVHADIRVMEQDEFGRIAYAVMEQVFAVHNEMGRFFDEDIYRDTVAGRVPGSQAEVRIEVRFEDFVKDYFIDLLVDGGAVFELKTVRALTAAHRSQLLNYLLLSGLSHGKLVNLRPELVEHEFVNTQLNHADRTAFGVVERAWQDPGPPGRPLKPWFVRFLRDIGAGLEVHLYEAAITHFFGGDEIVLTEVDVLADGRRIGSQKMRLARSGMAFKVTTIDEDGISYFEDHARRLLRHTSLRGFHWINVTRDEVTFTTIES